ncbi:MAG: DUF4091 domain-containing protein [Clostridia bacterium]|nr:DUF4091 domain-containing protein [Clostridia bacterium]
MKTAKRVLTLLLSVVLTAAVFVPSLSVTAADVDLSGSDFYLKLMSPDMQAFEKSENLAWVGSTTLNSYDNLTQVYLAKNEKEAYQVFFYEKGDGRDLRLEVDAYVDDDGNELPFAIYHERYFVIGGETEKKFAEALVPYQGEAVHVDSGDNTTFYVELRSAPDQAAGTYHSRFTLYNGDEVVKTCPVTAVVWNFALPEGHLGTTVMGLYNTASRYDITSGFLKKSGVRFENGDVAPEDVEKAERILEGWQEFLLDHGVTTYEIPRFLIDSDRKAAQLAMADVRRKAVMIPLLTNEGVLTSAGEAKILQYKDLIYDNPYLADKAFFYPADEESWQNESDAAKYTALCSRIGALWPGYHAVATLDSVGSNYDFVMRKFRETADIYCPNQAVIRGNQQAYDDYTDGSWYRTWRYSTNDQTGCIAAIRWGKTPAGTYVRTFYWQSAAQGTDGFLNWNCAYLPQPNGEVYDIWGTERTYGASWPANSNADGIILYESNSLGLDPATPIASLRLKHVSNGMDDYDYLMLAKEKFGDGPDSPYTQALNTVFRFYTSKGAKYTFSSEGSFWPDGEGYEWVGHDNTRFINARLLLGNALSEAGVEHDYSDWQIVVTPDETHNGLAVRTCADCGAEESREVALCPNGEHVYDSFVPVDEETHDAVCGLCGIHETRAHTPITVAGSAANCIADGTTDSVVCADCGKVLTAAQTIHGGHQYGEWIEGKAATCAAKGTVGHYHCSVCGKNFDAEKKELGTVTIPKDLSNHVGTIKTVGKKAATCEEDGYTGDRVCSKCGKTVKKGKTVAATGHSWDAGVVTKEATCTANGVKTFTCSECGQTKTETVEKLGHTQPDADGKCTRCGESIVNACKLCGEVHTGFLGSIVGFFHTIVYFFRNLFGKQ